MTSPLRFDPRRRTGRSRPRLVRLSPLIRWAAQSAEISLVGMPQTFSV